MIFERTATASLVGREGELRALADLIDNAPERGDAVAILGEAGIGKSSLLRAVTDQARERGLLVLEAIGVENETLLPFAGLHSLLRPVLDASATLPIAQRRAIYTAFGYEEGPPPEAFLIALAVLNLLADIATTRAIVVAVDDVHWLDHPSQEALAFVARRIANDPIVIIGTVRTGHGGPFITSGLPQLEVAGLDDDASRGVLSNYAADLSYADRERVLELALGNPLALVELPSALRTANDPSTGPVPLNARLERAFASRISELSALSHDAVLIAAADDVDELPEILAATAVLAGHAVTAAVLDEAADAGLVRVDERRVRFRHPLVRSGVLHAESVTRRQDAHAALASVLVNEPYRRTWHRAQAIVEPDDEVADELENSHTIALRRGSIMTAIGALQRSAELTTDSRARGRRYLLAAEHAFGVGRADLVDELLRAASDNSLSDLDRARMEWLREIFNDGIPGDATRVLELCEIAARSDQAGDTDLALHLLLGAALRCWWADTGPAARARVVDTALQLTDVDDDPRYVDLLGVAEPILQAERVAQLLARFSIESVSDADSLRLLGMAAHSIGDAPRAADLLDRAETMFRTQGRLGLLPHVLGMQVNIRTSLGDWERAIAAAEEGHRLGGETGQPIWSTGSLICGAMTAGLRGDTAHAFDAAGEVEQSANKRRLNDLLACVRLTRSYAWIGSGCYAEAFDELLPLFDPTDPSFHLREQYCGVMYLAEAAAHIDRRDDARKIIDGLEPIAAATRSPLLTRQLLYARPVLADDDRAEELFRIGLAEDLSRWPWIRARIELAYGSWLRRQRRVAESRSPLRSAQTTLELIGAAHWANQARGELRAAGEKQLGPVPTTLTELSAQELQIARLAAEGLSNREIGERLYLSPRTIGSHLYRIFPKLDITSRAQLASRLEGV